MSSESVLVEPGAAQWRDVLAATSHDVYHLPSYAGVDDLADATAVAYVYRDAGETLLIPLILREIEGTHWKDATSPYGYPGPVSTTGDPDFWQRALVSFSATMRDAGVVSCFVRLNPLLAPPPGVLEDLGTEVRHGPTVAVDLTRTPEEIWSGTRSNHRRQINRARREGMTTTVDDWDRLPEFMAIYHETMQRVDADEFYYFDEAYFARLRAALGDHLHLVVADHDGAAVAGAVLFECDGIVQYHLGGTRNAALPLQPMKLVLADAGVWAKARDARVLHLGGGVGGTDDPLLHFKAGFSDWHLPFATWRLVTDPVAYTKLLAERRPAASPADLTTYFPAYREPA